MSQVPSTPTTFRPLIDRYKAARAAWEGSARLKGVPLHKDMVDASDALSEALNRKLGIADEADDPRPPAAVLDDDGTVYLVVDNGWGQVPCIEAFRPLRASDQA